MASNCHVIHAHNELHTLRQYIYECITDFREKLTVQQVWSIAGNVAFLLRHNYGPEVNVDHISIPVINFVAQNDMPTQRICVIFHDHLERSRDMIVADAGDGENVLECLKKEVDKTIVYIMGYKTALSSKIGSGEK